LTHTTPLYESPRAVSGVDTGLIPMPFKPGQSGNPSGRPKSDYEIQALARAHTPAAIEALVEIFLDKTRTGNSNLTARNSAASTAKSGQHFAKASLGSLVRLVVARNLSLYIVGKSPVTCCP
jgi:Family of unknown function (DUF5681)